MDRGSVSVLLPGTSLGGGSFGNVPFQCAYVPAKVQSCSRQERVSVGLVVQSGFARSSPEERGRQCQPWLFL